MKNYIIYDGCEKLNITDAIRLYAMNNCVN